MATKLTLEQIQAQLGTTKVPSPSAVTSMPEQMGSTFSAKPKAGPTKLNKDQILAQLGKGKVDEDEYIFDPSDVLKKDDLKTGDRARRIRAHMVDRHGVDYRKEAGKSDDEVVEDFIDNMRWMNSNTVSVAGEVRFIHDAKDDVKERAKEAYQIYDQLGNVFTNDGFTGAVDGMKDYLFAAVADPSNYIGLLTGGMGKAAGVGLTQAGRAAVKKAAIEGGKQALKSGATQAAAKEAGEKAAKEAAKRFAANNIKTAQSATIRREAARRERDLFLLEAKKKAQRDVVRAQSAKDGKKILAATTAADAAFATLHDYTLQSTLIEAGAQENYSAMQTGFSSLLGGVGGLAQLGFGKFAGASGLSDADIKLNLGAKRSAEIDKLDTAVAEMASKNKRVAIDLKEEQARDAAAIIMEKADAWADKVSRGKDAYDDVPTSVSFIKEVMLGEDNKSGVAKFFKDQGLALPKGATVSDVMTSIVSKLPQEQLDAINNKIKPMGITLGDTTEIGQSLGDLLAVEISKGGQVLNVMSQVRKQLDAATIYGHEVIDGSVKAIDNLDAEAAKIKKAKLGEYGQNIWRRMLVSSPATTAVNVMGFGQFYVGQSLADIFSGTANTLWGVAQGGNMTKGGREALRVGRVYRQIQSQKIRNLLDPYTTHDAYMSFLKNNDDVSKVLFENFTGGVQRSAKRHGIDEGAKWFAKTEAVVDGANRLTGVKIQDTFTKSQMFMTEMDKWLRLNKNRTLADVLEKGDVDIIDNEVIGNALDTTLKSVFSKDYTTDDQLLANAAMQVEKFSNIPVIGTILPFGRFFNNTLATAYQWSVGGGVQMAGAMYNKAIKGAPVPETATEAFSRSLVGLTSLRLAMEFDDERRKQGVAYNMIDAGGGNTIDARNMFPVSLWLAVGRAGNLARNDEMVPQELIEDIAAQLAVGQFAKDVQFGNDLYNVFDTLFNGEPGARGATMDAVYKQGGNILAGFTRPIDAVNRMVGFINDTDAARDARQQTGVSAGVMGATKYVDNIIEIFTDKLDSVTGEELRVATREGSLKDANPILRIMGITMMPARTATEKAYSMAEMHPWKANERSQLPGYDKVFNELIQPQLESSFLNLVETDKFKSASVAQRREMLGAWKTELSKGLRDYMSASGDTGLDAVRRKAITSVNKNVKDEALKYMKDSYGFTGSIKEMTWEEVQLFLTISDYYKEITDLK